MNSQSYCFATFCFGERYRIQTNRLIENLEKINNNTLLFVITDDETQIKKLPWVIVKNINFYDSTYLKYATNYFDFDFSVKRFVLRLASENNFYNIVLLDTDNLVGGNYSESRIIESFRKNSILGPVIYEYQKEILSNSMLGRRFNHYEKIFDVHLNKKDLWMPEDCIQFISIEKNTFENFLNTWDECIKIKYRDNLPNIPAGNIDEMCFSALKNGINVGGNSDKSVNIFTAQHDLWYR
jgi:hypothetical protein